MIMTSVLYDVFFYFFDYVMDVSEHGGIGWNRPPKKCVCILGTLQHSA